MRLIKHLDKKSIITCIKPESKRDLFEKLIDAAKYNHVLKDIPEETILNAILAREKQSSTGIGDGFGFPHARLPHLRAVAISIAVLEEPMDYDSLDGKPVKIACMVLVPLDTPTVALKVMSQVARIFNDPTSKEKLTGAISPDDVYNCIDNSHLDLDVSITARDIMRKEIISLTPDMPLRKVTRIMADKHLLAAPVIGENKKMLGEISCDNLFSLGMPDFFLRLKSVAFISEFDPFEKYFHKEAHSKAQDVLSKDYCTIPPTATLLEIVFELVAKNRRKLYVLENGSLVGVIDQSIVLNQVVNI